MKKRFVAAALTMLVLSLMLVACSGKTEEIRLDNLKNSEGIYAHPSIEWRSDVKDAEKSLGKKLEELEYGAAEDSLWAKYRPKNTSLFNGNIVEEDYEFKENKLMSASYLFRAKMQKDKKLTVELHDEILAELKKSYGEPSEEKSNQDSKISIWLSGETILQLNMSNNQDTVSYIGVMFGILEKPLE